MLPVILTLLLILCLFLVVVWVRDCNRFIIKRYQIETTKIKKNIKMVVLADLHNKSYGKNNSILVEAINRQNPDMVMIAGDMITAREDANYQSPVELINNISKKYPVFYANGNHEHKMKCNAKRFQNKYNEYRKQISGGNVTFLENENVFLPQFNINISGLELDRKYFKRFHKIVFEDRDMETYLKKSEEDCYQILLAHNPEYFETYEKWGADLVLSGHVHGGIMKLPFLGGVIAPSFRLFPKYDGGLFHRGKAYMALSRGLGTHTLPVRIFNPGELLVIDISVKVNS